MLTRNELADLATHARARGIAVLALEGDGWSLRLEFEPRPAAPPPEAKTLPVEAPGFGTFLGAHPLAASPFAHPGEAVREGDILGLLRTGAIYRPVRAPASGTLDALCVETGALVGYGEVIARLHTGGPGHG